MIEEKKVITVIPARLGSYRFPTKPIELIDGIPMLERVYKGAIDSKYSDMVVVATPDEEIMEFCRGRNLNVYKSQKECKRGTERVYETYKNLMPDADIIVNLQGDEPLIDAPTLDLCILELFKDTSAASLNMYKKATYEEAESDQNEVKVVTDFDGYALYFSRNPLPAKWLGDKNFDCKLEICVMPFWAWSIEKFMVSREGILEDIESVDMLRLLENGMKVKMIEAPIEMQSVDVPEDIKKVERIILNKKS